MRLFKLLLVPLVMCLLFSTVPAQNKESGASKISKRLREMSLEELLQVKVTVATQTDETILSAPSSVSVFTRQQILDMGITTVEQLLNYVPGFQSTRESVVGNGFVVSARGQSTSQTSYNILFLVDGDRLNEDLTGGALIFSRYISTGNLKQVEVIRGPGSALYGTGAFTGVVNLITESGLNEARVTMGTLNSKSYQINLNRQIGQTQLDLYARHFGDDGQSYGAQFTHQINPQISSISDPIAGNDIYLKYGWRNVINLKLQYLDRSQDGFFWAFSDALPSDRLGQKHKAAYIMFTPFRKATHHIDISGGWVENRAELLSQRIADSTAYLESNRGKEQEWQFNLIFRSHPWPYHRFLLGVEWRHPEVLEDGIYNNKLNPGGDLVHVFTNVDKNQRHILGVYGQYQLNFEELINVTAGLRYDDYSDFGGAASPRTALIFYPGFGATLKLFYGEAFRAPSQRQTSSAPVGNPELDPEMVRTIEAAWLQKFTHCQFGLTYFRSSFTNKIRTVTRPPTAPPGGKRIFMNTADSKSSGLEFEGTVELGNLRLRGTITYLLEAEASPRYFAEKKFSIVANYHFKRLICNLNGHYLGEVEKDAVFPDTGPGILTLEDYFVLNASLRFMPDKRLTLLARIDNLLDTSYFSPIRLSDWTSGLPNRGRTASIGVEVPF